MPRYPKSIVKDYLDNNPDGNFQDFIKQTNCKMGHSNFNYLRRNYIRSKTGTLPVQANIPIPGNAKDKRHYSIRRKSPLKVYSRLWFHSMEGVPKETKDIIANLVQELNHSGVTNWELIELADPKQLEIREHTK